MVGISIIVPVYNVEPYLEKCVNSILNQTYVNFELILVNDGSTDKSGELCEKYAKNDCRIKVIHKSNGGLASARNEGIRIATGKYLLFCDSDDYVSEKWCENLIEKVTPSQNNYIFGGMNVIDRESLKLLKVIEPMSKSESYSISEYLMMQYSGIVGFACNVLYYSEIINENHLEFSTELIVEDLPFNLCYLKYMQEITFSKSADYNYIQDERETLSRKYYPDGYRKWREKYSVSLKFILEMLDKDKQEVNIKHLASTYLYYFINSLNNTFDERNKWSLCKKIKYNTSVVQSEEFQHCVNNADISNENKLLIYLFRKKNYCFAGLWMYLAKIKSIIINGG